MDSDSYKNKTRAARLIAERNLTVHPILANADPFADATAPAKRRRKGNEIRLSLERKKIKRGAANDIADGDEMCIEGKKREGPREMEVSLARARGRASGRTDSRRWRS